MARDVTERRVFRRAERVADEVWRMVRCWDRLAQETVGKPLTRRIDRVGANLAEGIGRGNHQDHPRFVLIAQGSLDETRHWLRRAHVRHLLTADSTRTLTPLLNELGPRLNACLRSIHPRESGPSASAPK
jgi:four helix bundle protein